ncbi:MAG: EAL domain-containing protein [Rhizobiaceae bacterium]|nr:EAL domain-containing protein [Rhizobiaceae bacterium]
MAFETKYETGGPDRTTPAEANAPWLDPKIAERYLWLEAMVNHVPDYIYVKDLQGRFLYANHAIVSNNGLSSVGDIIGLTDVDLHGKAAEDARITEIEQRVIETGEPDLGFEEKAMRGGPDRWLMMSRVPLKDRNDKTIGIVGTSRDISAKKAAERLIQAQARILEMIVSSVAIPQFMEELTGLVEGLAEGIHCAAVVFSADGAAPLSTTPFISQLPDTLVEALASSSTELLRDTVSRLTSGAGNLRCFEILSVSGDHHGLISVSTSGNQLSSSLIEFLAGASRMAGIAIDRRQAEEQIRFLAEHDALTRLLNRSSLEQRLPDILAGADLSSRKLAIGFLDLDNFKQINDTLGHAAGDELLRQTAARLTASMGGNDIVARIGGDEFILVLHEDDEGFEAKFGRIRSLVSHPLTIEGMDLQVNCSIGVACFPTHGRLAPELFKAADLAMYRAKETGRNSLQIFSPDIADNARRKFLRAEELRRAVERDEFILHFQPQIDLRTGLVSGVETLVRWMHPAEGLVGPSDFIPLAEETGIIVTLGEMILRKACRQARKWQDENGRRVRISVNVSPRQFQNHDIIAQVAAALKESGLEPSLLEIEITESLIMQDVDAVVGMMGELTDMGVGLSIDDFGTGYSCLSMLKTLPLSRLKIDRSFLTQAPEAERDSAIVSTIITLARSLNLDVVAEGVETQGQADFLRDAGCDHGQGYFFSRPVGEHAIEALLDRRY